MNSEEKEFIKNVNIDKAKNKTRIAIILLVVSLLTYIAPTISGDFDFGVIFELVSLILILIGRNVISENNITKGKKFVIGAMIPVGWLLIYDLFNFMILLTNGADIVMVMQDLLFGEILSIGYMIISFSIISDISRTETNVDYKSSEDWYYKK